MININEIAKSAKKTSKILAGVSEELRNKALLNIADKLESNLNMIFESNKKDLESAKSMLLNNEITESTYNRLKLDNNKARDMIQGVRDVAKLDNPINKLEWRKELDSDLVLSKISCPIGVIGVIFEARPDVISQISSLAIKSANCVILKGGRESINTNKTIYDLILNALSEIEGIPDNIINLVYSREDVSKMLQCDQYIDLIIPRGSNKLVKFIKDNTKIPVLGHASGICHIFVDLEADYKMALDVILDAKLQYTSACNSVETLLIHKDFCFIDKLKQELIENGIKIVENPLNWSVEYGDKILNLKIVDNVYCAIEHINSYGSGHTDSIITKNDETAKIFLVNVDSAGVYRNASTRFADGFRYGFGAEVGISTNKTHARGPVGLDGLTIYKYILEGNGNIVGDYVTEKRHFNYKNLV